VRAKSGAGAGERMSAIGAPASVFTAQAIGKRLGRVWPTFIFLAIFGWLDWLTHRQLGVTIFGGGAIIALILFWPQLIVACGLQPLRERTPPFVPPLLLATPGMVYLLTRGAGTSDAGPAVVVTAMLLIAVFAFFGQWIDARMSGWYRIRNRVLPRFLRIILTPIVAILLSFAIVHGSLTDLPALWGAGTATPKRVRTVGYFGESVAVVDTATFVLAAILAALVAMLLLREEPARRAATAEGAPAPGPPPPPPPPSWPSTGAG